MAVLGFDPGAVVAIVADDGSSLGSGYALGNGRVLTAKHVVGTRTRVVVGGSPMTPCWTGSTEQADIALLAPDDETQPIGPPRVVLHHGDALGKRWMANGFPALVGQSDPASGTVEPGQSPDGHSHISVVAFPKAAEAWKGMSGAAVFVNNQLWAVLHSASGWRYGMLKAVPLRPFLDTGLRAALGLPDQLEERHALARSKIVAELNPPTLARMVAAHPDWAKKEGSEREAIAEAMLATQPPSALAEEFQRIFESLLLEHKNGTDRQDLARSIMRVFEWAMPYASGWRHISTPVDESGCRAMKAYFALTVEPSVAWNAERAMRVEPHPEPRPIGQIDVPASKLTAAAGARLADQGEVVLDEFAEQLDELAMTWFAEKNLKQRYERLPLRRKLEFLNKHMAGRERGITYFTFIEDIVAIGGRPLLRFLRDHLPVMDVVVSALTQTDPGDDAHWDEESSLDVALLRIYETYAAITKPKS